MMLTYSSKFLLVLLGVLLSVQLSAEEVSHPVAVCTATDSSFADSIWSKVGEQICLKCHNSKGDAAESEFVLRSTLGDRGALAHNLAEFREMAKAESEGQSRLLLKVQGELDHEGGAVLPPNSSGYRILHRFVERVRGPSPQQQQELFREGAPFFDGVQMVDDQRLLRRLTLSLAARLPTDEERETVKKNGHEAIDEILDELMTEDAFYERLKEGFNDIFLTTVPRNGIEMFSWAHFPNRTWTQNHDLSDVPEDERQRTRWSLAAVYRETIQREPMELIAHIVRNDRPFTEIVTADYMMVSPYSSRGYGIYEDIRDQFEDPDDPFEYIPAKLPALKDRKGKQVQESETGIYPHAGLLSTFHYVRRYPTTDTNRNRLRARKYYEHFLGIDVMALAPRVSDAAAILEEYDNPTMEAADCVVCHRSVDPVAGLFQDFNDEGHFGPRREGWHEDMFAAGLEGDALGDADRWRALQWLGEQTAQDPRFATAMVEHVWYILFGRKVLTAPQDIDDPRFGARRRAYQSQRVLIEEVAAEFAKADFNLKVVFKALALSDFYRADGLAAAIEDPCRLAELDDVGLVTLLTPEQLERKIEAVFGAQWGRLKDRESKFGILYGGIDSYEVTERVTEPSGAMGAIQRMLSNEVACRNVALDFTRKPAERRLFPDIEPDVIPGDEEAEQKIRRAVVHLHQHILGRELAEDDPEVERTYQLFAAIIAEAHENGFDKNGSYFCERVNEQFVDDSHYAIRAWRAVVTYLLRQPKFLYQ